MNELFATCAVLATCYGTPAPIQPIAPYGSPAYDLQIQQQNLDVLRMYQQRNWDWYKAQQGWDD